MKLRSTRCTFALVVMGSAFMNSALAQQVETDIALTLWIDAEPARVAVAADMIEALLRKPAQGETLTKVAGIQVLSVEGGATALVGASQQLTGIVECLVKVSTLSSPNAQQRQSLHDHLAVFVDNELQAVTVGRPRRLLMEQIEAEQQRWREATNRLAELPIGLDFTAATAQLQQQRLAVTTEIAEARMLLAVEGTVRSRLRELHDAQQKQRNDLEARRREIQQRFLHLQSKASELQARLAESSAALALAREAKSPEREASAMQQIKDQQDMLRALEQEQAMAHAATEDAVRGLDELTQTATFAAEQLPANELQLLRTDVRMKALAEQDQRLEVEEKLLAESRAKASRSASEADLLRIDQQVARDRLVELKGKLARIEPLRIDVLSGR